MNTEQLRKQFEQCWNDAHQAGRFEGKGIAEEDWQTFEHWWKENESKLTEQDHLTKSEQ